MKKIYCNLLSDIDECQDPAIAAQCTENAWCCNLPAHYTCKCNDGFTGDGFTQCTGESDGTSHS